MNPEFKEYCGGGNNALLIHRNGDSGLLSFNTQSTTGITGETDNFNTFVRAKSLYNKLEILNYGETWVWGGDYNHEKGRFMVSGLTVYDEKGVVIYQETGDTLNHLILHDEYITNYIKPTIKTKLLKIYLKFKKKLLTKR